MGNSIKSSLRGRRRCGVCLFELDQTKAQPSRHLTGIDAEVDIDWILAFATRDTYEFTYEQLTASARQGCATCAALLKALERFGTGEFTTARWEPDSNNWGAKHPVLIVDDTDERFELFTAPEVAAGQGTPSLHPIALAARQLSTGSTGGEATLRQAAEWLGKCRREHESCRPHDEGFVPTRLLFLGGQDAGVVHLIEHPAPSTAFATLSHRWTEETLGVRLERDNLDLRKREGMRVAEFPLMMRQVVAALRGLGIEHVWIDCMCIVQDDGDDWMREAATMASIYANAELTIGSTWGSKAGDGLFHEREGPAGIEVATVDVDEDGHGHGHGHRSHPVMLRRALPHFRWQEFRGGNWFMHDPRVAPDQEWPLLARGWVYQEQLLSRRMLHFARGEAVWECFGARSCECGWHDRDAGEALAGKAKQAAAGKRWEEVLTEYAGRPLTFETDRLPAVAGVAKAVGRAKGVLSDDRVAYVCGLFTAEDDLRDTLFWYLTERPQGARLDSSIPTWSWASVASTALGFWSYLHEDIEIGGVEASFPEGADPYMGQIEQGASVTLSGRILQGTMHHGRDWARTSASLPDEDDAGGRGHHREGVPDEESFVLGVGDRWATFRADYRLDEPGKSFVPSGAPVSCLLIGSASEGSLDPETGEGTERVVPCFLVLRCVDAAGARYERLGMYEGSGCLDGEWLDLKTFVDTSEKQKITMI
ncbi:hypothetical protein ESCO_006587 [Escovopsis weberi]|uniref:Heterokaryon incompatibility domain-containing protein n=1 Tax=Escovopsis weberi TaxID=150374 RepID=A0A0M9VXQ5_ESCWE|nr:hypothetical protein ESCO_006587 [Escovopsis weberi]